jgi:hypothetical protein
MCGGDHADATHERRTLSAARQINGPYGAIVEFLAHTGVGEFLYRSSADMSEKHQERPLCPRSGHVQPWRQRLLWGLRICALNQTLRCAHFDGRYVTPVARRQWLRTADGSINY